MSTNWNPEAVLAHLGHTLPEVAPPVASYVPFRRHGDLLYVAGQIPRQGGTLLHTGRVPDQVSLEQARACAVQCALNGLAVVKAACGSLGALRQVIRLGVFVACGDGFTEHPKVADGASDLMVKVFGEAGKHARAAVGSSSLPLGAPVEIEFLFEVG